MLILQMRKYRLRDFPGGSDGKASAYNAGDPGAIPGLGRSPGEGNGQPTPVFLPGKSHGQRSPVGYSLWGCKESGTTKATKQGCMKREFKRSAQPHGADH